jgi:hypothetical protein
MRVTGPDLQPASDTFRSLSHDRKTVPSVNPLVSDSLSVVRHFYMCIRGIYGAGYPQIGRSSVLAGVRDRLLRDAQKLRLDGAGQPARRVIQ